MNNQTKNFIKILLSLFFAFIIVNNVGKRLFLNNTPKINQSYLLEVRNSLFAFLDDSQRFLASLLNPRYAVLQNKIKKYNSLPTSAMQSVGTGVYAKEDELNNITYIRITKDSEWEERTIIMDGKQVTIRIPKGSTF